MKRTQLDQVLELRLLPVTLSRGELADRAAELARVVEERGTLDLARKADAARWRFKLDAVAEAVERLAHVVASGAEDRETEVTAWLEGTDWIVLRRDTGDEIERRPATPEELQTRLFEAPAVDLLLVVLAGAFIYYDKSAGWTYGTWLCTGRWV